MLGALEYKIIVAVRKNLNSDQLPWGDQWLFAKVQNEDRDRGVSISSTKALEKSLRGLLKKNLVRMLYPGRYALNVEATRVIK